MPSTLFDKLWNTHVVAELDDTTSLLYVDRHLVHDLGGGPAYAELRQRGLGVPNPELTFATPDHVVSSLPGRTGREQPWAAELLDALRAGSHEFGIRLFDLAEPGQGIVHVIGPELGLTLPGLLVLCGDSHTTTHGALGALAWGIGASEIVHVLATQTIVQKRPRRMRVRFTGTLQPGVEAKDLALAMIGRIGAAGATGHAVEYAGPVIERLGMAGRMTLCNLSIEMGARHGLIAPDATTYAWLEGRRHAPRGEAWAQALRHWQGLRSDDGARFDREEVFDANTVAPQITWGTSPEQTMALGSLVPDPAAVADQAERQAMVRALEYMGLAAGQSLAGTPIDWVFIGSCTNSRLEDLRAAAARLRGRRVARNVTAWVVPGSELTRRQAEQEGLDRLFLAAGFEWRQPGCSLCVGANGELVAPRQRCVSTSNRNFVGRQGPLARTHLASPAVAVECALAGCIVDHLDAMEAPA